MTLCEHCNKKKVSIIPFTCKCGYQKLCSFCRLPEEHKCKFDFKTHGKEKLIKDNPLVVKSKIETF